MKLQKSSYDKVIAGVCGGVARYLNMDATVVRLLFVLASIFGVGSPVLIYIVMALVMPND